MAKTTKGSLIERRKSLLQAINQLQTRFQQYQQAVTETQQQIQTNSGAVAMLNALLQEDFDVDLEKLDQTQQEENNDEVVKTDLEVVDVDNVTENVEVEEISL